MFAGGRRGAIALAVAVMVAVGSVSAVSSASAATADDGADDGAGVEVDAAGVSAARVSSASALARQSGQPVVIDELTTSIAQTRAMPDGTMQYEVSSVPVRARKDGDWVPIDTTLARAGDWFEPQASATPVRFSAGGTDVLDQVQSPTGEWVTETWPHGALPAPTVDGSTATYAEVLPGVDLKLTATELGMASVYVVKTEKAARGAALRDLHVEVDGAQVARTKEGVFTADAGRGDGLRASSPLWWDSSHGATFAGPGGDDPMMPVVHDLDGDSVSMDVAATVSSKDVSYPVFVDPDWSSGITASWYTDKAYPDQSYLSAAQSDVLRVGTYAQYDSAMFFQFPIGALAGKQVLSAQLGTTQISVDACPTNPIVIEVYGPQGPGFTWNQSQSWGGQWGGVLQTQTPGSCSSPSTPVAVGWDVTAGVQSRIGQSVVQLGLTSQAAAQSRRHYSRDATLYVNYDTPPDTPTDPKFITPARACGTAAAPTVLGGTSVTVGFSQTDPDPGNVDANVFLYKASDLATVVQHQAPGLGAQGAKTVTFTGLVDGQAYAWQARGSDWIVDGPGVSPWCYFKVDNAAPVAPTVTGDGSAAVVGAARTVTLARGTSTDVAGFEYWFAYGSATSPVPAAVVPISTTGALPACGSAQGAATFVCLTGTSKAITVAPVDGRSVLWVAAFDAAGNLSPASPLALVNPDGTVATRASTLIAHYWPIYGLTGPLSTPVADTNTSTGTGVSAGKPLTIGSGIAVDQTATVKTGTTGPVLTFFGATPVASTVATSSAAIDTKSSFSVSAWVKTTTTSGTHVILAQSGATRSGFVLQEAAGHLQFCMQPQSTTGAAVCATQSAALTKNSWSMVTGVWDAVNKQLRVVVGESASPVAVVPYTLPAGEVTAAGVFTVGSGQVAGAAANPWAGAITNPFVAQGVIDTASLGVLKALS